MNNSTAIFLINDDVKAVKATYEEHETPKVFKTMNPDVQVDDLVIVPCGTRHGMTVCKVTEIDVDIDFDSREEIKWVVGIVDQKPFELLKSQEREAIDVINAAEKRQKRDALREAMLKNHMDEIKQLPIASMDEGQKQID